MGRISINIADYVGRTPMVQLTRMAPEGALLFGKLEMFNPGGSVKDRIGVAMIDAAEAEGRIEPGRTTIVEATSGNTGIALAFVCAAKGYDLVLTLPQGMSREREGLLRLYGAQVHVTESLGGMNEAVAAAQAMARDEDVFLPDQFTNPANPEAHRRTTGPELWDALDGEIDYLVAGVGTGGTITGAGSFLKERNPRLKVIAVEPAASPVLSGGRPGPHKIQGIGAGFVPPVLDRELIDEIVPVDDEDAIETARAAARK
jgi:cysteine synthase